MRIEVQGCDVSADGVLANAILEEAGIVTERWGSTIPPDRLLLQCEHDGRADATLTFRDITPADMAVGGSMHHTHIEHVDAIDERRYVILGTGKFNVRRRDGTVVTVHIDAGDFISIKHGRYHWFDVGASGLRWIEFT